MFRAERTQSCIQMTDIFLFFLFSFSHAAELVRNCQATVAQNKIQAISSNCSNSVKIYYDSTIKWLCGSSITSKQTGKKSCFIRVVSSSYVSFSLPPDYLHPLFFLSWLTLPPTSSCCCCCSTSSLHACALFERARGS